MRYAELTIRLKMSEPAVRVAVHRLRARYRQFLRDEVAQTVSTEEEIDDELRQLHRTLTRQPAVVFRRAATRSSRSRPVVT